MEITFVDLFCAPAAKPRLAMPMSTATAAATKAGVVAAWSGVTVRDHVLFATRGITGLPAWSPPTC